MTGLAYILIKALQLGVLSSLLKLCGFEKTLKTFRMFEAKYRYVMSVL